MKANELRIGNYTDKGQVKSFYESGIHVGLGKTFNFSSIAPIKLDEEWLQKLGFKKEFHGCFIEQAGFPVWQNIHNNVAGINSNDFYAGSNGAIRSVIHLKYVHQLQNLYFALTGEELVIKDGI